MSKPLRILFVADAVYPYSKGGKETRLHELSTRLAGMGHDVHVCCMRWWDGPRDIVEDGVHLHGISKVYPLYRGDRRSIKQGVLFGLACLKLVSYRFDVIDIDSIPVFPLFSGWLVCALRRKKLFSTWHEVWGTAYWIRYMGPWGRVAALLERLSVRLPYRVVAVSEQTACLLASVLNRREGVVVVPNGVDLAHMDSVPPGDERSDVIFAARLLKHKNANVLLEAVHLLRQDLPDVRCLIVGNGPEEARLKSLRSELALEENVIFRDFYPDIDDLYALLKASKVYALPSEREGFGLGVLEANACRLPAVTVDVPGNAARWLIQEGMNGSVVALSPAALCGGIRAWLDTPRKVTSKVPRDLDWTRLAEELAQVYAE